MGSTSWSITNIVKQLRGMEMKGRDFDFGHWATDLPTRGLNSEQIDFILGERVWHLFTVCLLGAVPRWSNLFL